MALEALILSLQQSAIERPFNFLFNVLTLLSALYFVANEYIRYSARVPGIPGPTGLPLIGNLWQIRKNAAEQYRLWSKKYGGVFQVQLGNIPVLVINTAASAKVLFGQNAQALSSRPEFYTFHKIVSDTAGTTIGTSPFSDSLKRRRKGAASALNRPSVDTYVHHLDLETKVFISEFVEYGDSGREPVDPMTIIQRLSLSLALTLNWGTRMRSQQDELFDEITHVEEEISRFRSTTGNLQDYIPLLRLNPFNPGSKRAREMRGRRDKYLGDLNRGLDERIEKGTYKPCIQANIILDEEAKLNKEELTSISLTMLSGGLDTIITLLQWSIALLAQRPDIQDKAIADIRKLYRADQPLCDALDDQNCPYIAALVKECLRYYTILRLALPRTSVKDITYEGKRIPKGTVFFLNAWACNMDPEVWSSTQADPLDFVPERWFSQPDAPMFTYGMGYRMCAGSLLANRELYLVFIRLISCFEIEQVDHVNTHPVEGNLDPTSLVSMPHRYCVRMVPRDEKILKESLEKFVPVEKTE